MHIQRSEDEQTQLMLILKYGSMANAFTEFLGVAKAFSAEGFTQAEFDCLAEYEYYLNVREFYNET